MRRALVVLAAAVVSGLQVVSAAAQGPIGRGSAATACVAAPGAAPAGSVAWHPTAIYNPDNSSFVSVPITFYANPDYTFPGFTTTAAISVTSIREQVHFADTGVDFVPTDQAQDYAGVGNRGMGQDVASTGVDLKARWYGSSATVLYTISVTCTAGSLGETLTLGNPPAAGRADLLVKVLPVFISDRPAAGGGGQGGGNDGNGHGNGGDNCSDNGQDHSQGDCGNGGDGGGDRAARGAWRAL